MPVPEKCKPIFQKAQVEGDNFLTYMKIFLCDQASCEKNFTFDKITESDIDSITNKVLHWAWKIVNPPLSLKDDVLPFYKEIKENCFKSNTQFRNLFTSDTRHVCKTEKDDKLLTDIVNNCVIPKVAHKPCSDKGSEVWLHWEKVITANEQYTTRKPDED